LTGIDTTREESDWLKLMPEINISIAIPTIKQYTTSAKVSAAALRHGETALDMTRSLNLSVNMLVVNVN